MPKYRFLGLFGLKLSTKRRILKYFCVIWCTLILPFYWNLNHSQMTIFQQKCRTFPLTQILLFWVQSLQKTKIFKILQFDLMHLNITFLTRPQPLPGDYFSQKYSPFPVFRILETVYSVRHISCYCELRSYLNWRQCFSMIRKLPIIIKT